MDTTAGSRTPEVDDATPFLSYSMLRNMIGLISNKVLYSIRNKLRALYKLRFQRGSLPLVFYTLTESVEKALDIIQPRPPQVKVTKHDEHGDTVVRSSLQPPLPTSYINLWLVSFAPGWYEPALDMERSRSEEKGTMYVKTTLRERKMGNSPLETGAGAGGQLRGGEAIEKESEPTAS